MPFFLAWWLSWPLRIVTLSRVEVGRTPWVSKKQHGWTPTLVAVTQAIFRLRFRTLTGAAWIARERDAYARLHGLLVRVHGASLRLPRLPGRTVDAVLVERGPGVDPGVVIAACAQALYRAHQSGDGAFSHGDATVRNFLYEPVTGIARLFDFETEHDPTQPQLWRRADDLRALSGSAAACLPPTQYPHVVRAIVGAYPDPAVRSACLAEWHLLQHRPDPLHLAQTRLDASGHGALIRAWDQTDPFRPQAV
jgi:hypothetical protein